MTEPGYIQKIIHVDMDAFYASVEQRDHPELRGKAIAVGGSPNGRGVVATCSYEAREFGVRSAMPSRTALNLCPQLTFVRPRFEVYKDVSGKIRAIFRRYTDLIEPLSLDEAYLDVTQNKINHPKAIHIARLIKQDIQKELNLTASAGVSYNKFLAKMASDLDKPDGLSFIGPEDAADFIAELPVGKFHGIGKATASRMHKAGIFTGADLRDRTETELVRRFGKMGRYFHRISQGIDTRRVSPHRKTKSISVEDTFPEDLTDMKALDEKIRELVMTLWGRIEKKNLMGRTLTLKVKYGDFTQISRSRTADGLFDDREKIQLNALDLLRITEAGQRPIRLLGVGVSNFPENDEPGTSRQLTLW